MVHAPPLSIRYAFLPLLTSSQRTTALHQHHHSSSSLTPTQGTYGSRSYALASLVLGGAPW